MGGTTLLVNEVEAITGNVRATDIGISYQGDNVILLRYLEIDGALHTGIGVLKKASLTYSVRRGEMLPRQRRSLLVA